LLIGTLLFYDRTVIEKDRRFDKTPFENLKKPRDNKFANEKTASRIDWKGY
jgi:hypothetical protein